MTDPAVALAIPPLDPQARITASQSSALTLPDRGQYAWLQEQVGGLPEPAYYHPDAVLHVHGNGQAERLPLNPVAWTLASAWRGAQLPYPLFGTVLITGDEDQDGNFIPLSAPLADQTQNAIAAATAWWRDNYFHLPVWPFSLDSPAFAPAITTTRLAV
ncbi:DUF3846 domain-containing protein (plasmid) [Streptomyces sp. NBC_00015]|uniref:DUF3846 domain-containing protein n=1 Tax=Streptomyces sp. NBC_00015 TaxID=2903611 RepID=UPI002F913262